MKKEEFVKVVVNEIKEFLPESYQRYEVQLKEILKVNLKKTALFLKKADNESQVSPVVYLDDFYKLYQEGETKDNLLAEIARMLLAAEEEKTSYLKEMMSWDEATNRIFYELINAEKNEELLSDVPHRKFCDLAIVYRLAIETEGEFATALVNNLMMKEMELTEEKLYALATVNTQRLFPEEICLDLMTIITNGKKLFGATAILYDGVLKKVADEIGNDLFLIPSSIHEMLAVPAYGDEEKLIQIVYECNRNRDIIDEAEVLSDSVYRYCRATDMVERI